MEILRRLIGLGILLVIEAVSMITTRGAVTSKVEPLGVAALAVGCVLSGYFLRTWWALLIVPVVFWAGMFGLDALFGVPIFQYGEGHFSLAVMAFGVLIVGISIPVVLLALLGAVLGKRLSGSRATIAA